MLEILDAPGQKGVAFHWRSDCPRLPIEPVIDPESLNPVYQMEKTLVAKVVEGLDTAIANAIFAAAQEESIDEVYLLDRKFCLDAIREKIERMTGGNGSAV